MYGEKYISPEKAAKLVKSGDWVDYSFCLGMPFALDRALAARKEELVDVKIRGGIALRPLEVIECDPELEHFTYSSWHLSGYERKMSDLGRCVYIPLMYQNEPLLYSKICSVDVAFLTTTPMDKDGYFNFSLTNSASHAIIKRARCVVLEINENYPVVGGRENSVHISDVDYVVESGNPAMPCLSLSPSNDIDTIIAAHVMEQIQDGAVIQLGIGALPNTIGRMIADSDLKNLGGHTEMLVDSYATMMESGRMTNLSKSIDTGKTVFTFGAGTQAFYDWVGDNTDKLAPYNVAYTNDSGVLARHQSMISINSCLHVDLFGQISAESVGLRQISGSGGQFDFTLGAMRSPQGKAFLCCASVKKDKKTGALQSNIVPLLQPGTIITTSRSAIHYLVTEWGMAELAGQTIWERTRRIIAIAHPDFREQLTEEARTMKLLK